MSPQDFLDSLINDEPKERIFRRVVKEEQVKKMLKRTPPLRKGSSKLFRELGENGLISYAEYVFMITLLTSKFFLSYLFFHTSFFSFLRITTIIQSCLSHV